MNGNHEGSLAPPGVRIDQAYFDRLPALLTPWQMRLVTGLNYRELRVLEDGKGIGVWRLNGVRKGRKRRYRKYYKRDAAKLTGFRV
jgi:hypothetical protein